MTCGDLQFFFTRGLDILDQNGVRVPSKEEANARSRPRDRVDVFGCGRNILIPVPPHSCMHGNFDKPDYDFVKDLSEIYSLPPGLYTITSKPRTDEQKQPTDGLTVEVIP